MNKQEKLLADITAGCICLILEDRENETSDFIQYVLIAEGFPGSIADVEELIEKSIDNFTVYLKANYCDDILTEWESSDEDSFAIEAGSIGKFGERPGSKRRESNLNSEDKETEEDQETQ